MLFFYKLYFMYTHDIYSKLHSSMFRAFKTLPQGLGSIDKVRYNEVILKYFNHLYGFRRSDFWPSE